MELYLDKETYLPVARAYLARWHCLPDGEPFVTPSSLLWPVTSNGDALMLKIVDPDDDEAHAADILRLFNGHGAVRLIRAEATATLLERLVSNGETPTLEDVVLCGQDDKATHIICDVIEKLHAAAANCRPPSTLIPLRNRSDEMCRHVVEGRVKPHERPMFQIADDVCSELVVETKDSVMPLHGDVHHFNILPSERGWLAIDPKGILGPRAYEYANTLCNPCLHTEIVADPKRMARQARIICERASLDKDLLLGFTFLHAMQCAAWSLSAPDQSYWMACGRTAAKLADIGLPA